LEAGSLTKAFEKAENLLRNANLDEVCKHSGASRSENNIIIRYFNNDFLILLPDVVFKTVYETSDNIVLTTVDKLLILHYLLSNGEEKTNGDFVGYKDLPGGMFYYSTYFKQGPNRIIKCFEDNPKGLYDISLSLGGEKLNYGDASVCLKIFPNIEIRIVLYREDVEFPKEAYILYKDDIINYLNLKDISMLSGEIAGRFSRMKRETKNENEIELHSLDKNFKYEIASRPGAGYFTRCFSCGTCTASCPVSEIDENFNPRMFIRRCLLGQRELVLSSKELWFCVQCYTCYARCPQDVRFTDVMAVLRDMAVEEGYISSTMMEKAKKIEKMIQNLRHSITEYTWMNIKGKKDNDMPGKLVSEFEKMIKELG